MSSKRAKAKLGFNDTSPAGTNRKIVKKHRKIIGRLFMRRFGGEDEPAGSARALTFQKFETGKIQKIAVGVWTSP